MLALFVALSLGLAETPLDRAQERLTRGDAFGAARALQGVECPAPEEGAARASWLDAQARIAWHQGRMERAFALSVRSIACAERAGVSLAPFLPAFVKDRDWIDPGCGLALRVLPTVQDEAAREQAAELAGSAEAQGESGAWVRLAARLMDPSRPAENVKVSEEGSKPARRRMAFLQAALAARVGDAEVAAVELRKLGRETSELQPLAQWFEAEALLRRERPDCRTAALRFVQCAAALDDAPWIRAAALRRAAGALDTTDPAEAARLRAAADEETP